MTSDRRIKRRQQDIRQDIEARLEDLGVPMPHLFLAEIVAGSDPRGGVGLLRTYVNLCKETEDDEGVPSAEAWGILRDLVLTHPAYAGDPVTLQESTAAARELLTYIAPKLKAVEVVGTLDSVVRIVPLTSEEIADFNKKFLDDF